MDSHSENPRIVSASLNCKLNAANEVYGTHDGDEEDPIAEETPISMYSSETIPDLDSNDDKGDSAEAELRFCDSDELVEPKYKILPPKYYVKRWTRKATEDDVFDPFGELIPNNSDPSSTARYDALLQISQISQRIATKCSKSEEVFSLTNLLLQEVEAKMEGCNTKEERRPPVQKTTIKTTPAVQETTIQTTPAVQETTIETTPAVQQTTIKTTPAVQETIMKTTPAVQKTTIKTTPAVKKTTTKTTPAVQEATIKTTPAVRKTTIKTTPAVQETTIKTTPTVQKTTIKTTPAVKKTTTKTNPAVKKTTTKTNAAVKKTTTKTNRNQEASGLLPGQQQQPNHSQTGWQWMSQRAVPPLRAIQPLFVAEPLQVVYPQGVHPPDILPPYNSVTCQGRPYLQNSLFAPQQESSSQIEP
ncbi:hypothetical protein MKX03_029416 [Papaver bracteatum]|nr:hypothetical protein MKX03_029416 [Papaver bracteatum]